MMDQKLLEQIVSQVLAAMPELNQAAKTEQGIPVGVSNRHIHLSAEHIEALFGCGYSLTKEKDLKQINEFAAKETVTLVGPKGVMRGVRVLGPVRKSTQIEISRTDGFALGIAPPLRDSGNIKGSPGIVIVGTKGAATLTEGVICATRHIHMEETDARRFNVADGDRVTVKISGPRGGTFGDVLVRVNPNFRLEFHIDTDEANAVFLKTGDTITLCK
ncbi:Phosphate propanoyltransferase [Sporomusa silvacetica DSM 10669]|uniref:Phosphate propanoyltransferase n=1 Tax=Sporomusa silvacetica DSM 10669 TaxID=1123289 RepID=A0ABZ3IST6_9FIRM|nr:phosphate propanoyltransferase [Sporomusa silvacetica]OZC14479.1 phosphate propanoyltransferase [Sporomusa silvacetica DSM 10669]